MAYFDSILLEIKLCLLNGVRRECGEYVNSDLIPIPQPNYLADNSSDDPNRGRRLYVAMIVANSAAIYLFKFGGEWDMFRTQKITINVFEEPYEELGMKLWPVTRNFETSKREIENLTELNKQVLTILH
jgi:hypothetical protein